MKKNNLLFVADDYRKFKLDRDSTAAMMRIAIKHDITCSHCSTADLFVNEKGEVCAKTINITDAGSIAGSPIIADNNPKITILKNFSAVIMRKDPPFNMSYVMSLWLLNLAQKQGAVVVNNPSEILAASEKTIIFDFPQYIAPTIINGNFTEIYNFAQKYSDIVIKPLNSFDGLGVRRYHINQGENELKNILQKYPKDEYLMVQKYLTEITNGDKRIFIIGDKVIPYANNRYQKFPDDRENLGHEITNEVVEINSHEKNVAQAVADKISQRGHIIVGIDMIAGFLTEINVTSPTCMIEIELASGINVAKMAIDEAIKYSQTFVKN